MSAQWFYRLFDEEFGPVPRPTLEELYAKGTLGSTDEVRADGSSQWQPLEAALAASAVATQTATADASGASADSADEELNWFYQFMGDEMGPVSFNELLEFAKIGQLTADDQIKYGATGKWRRLGAVGRLVAVLPYQEPTAARPTAKPATNGGPIVLDEAPAEPAPPTPAPAPKLPPVPRYLPAAEEKSWYAWIRGTEAGPTDLIEINQWITTGQIGAADFVRYGMMGQWAPPATAVQALLQLRLPDDSAATAPVAAPPPPPTRPVTPPVPAAPVVESKLKLPPPPGDEKPSPPPRESRPPAESPKTAPTSRPSAGSVDAPPKATAPEPRPEPPSPPPRTTSSYGGGSSGGGMSSPPAWQTASKPSAYKPPPKKKSSGGGGGLPDALKEPKTLGIIGGVIGVVLLGALWSFLPASKGADIAKLKQLEELLTDFRKVRDEKGDWGGFEKKAEEITKPIVEELKNTANRNAPAKQCLLWAARDALPRMVSTAKDKPGTAAEKEYEGYIFEAQRILGVGDPPPRPAATEDDGASSDESTRNE